VYAHLYAQSHRRLRTSAGYGENRASVRRPQSWSQRYPASSALIDLFPLLPGPSSPEIATAAAVTYSMGSLTTLRMLPSGSLNQTAFLSPSSCTSPSIVVPGRS
jgi:hypothetical protein